MPRRSNPLIDDDSIYEVVCNTEANRSRRATRSRCLDHSYVVTSAVSHVTPHVTAALNDASFPTTTVIQEADLVISRKNALPIQEGIALAADFSAISANVAVLSLYTLITQGLRSNLPEDSVKIEERTKKDIKEPIETDCERYLHKDVENL